MNEIRPGIYNCIQFSEIDVDVSKMSGETDPAFKKRILYAAYQAQSQCRAKGGDECLGNCPIQNLINQAQAEFSDASY